MKNNPPGVLACVSRRTVLRAGALLVGGPVLRLSAATADARPDFAALSLDQQVGQMVIARLPDWPLMEKYAGQEMISGLTPGLTKLTPAEVAEFTNRFQRLSPIPLLFGERKPLGKLPVRISERSPFGHGLTG